jgi:hypothetical protein
VGPFELPQGLTRRSDCFTLKVVPNRSSKRGQGPKDFHQIAYEVFQKAIGEIPKDPPPDPNKNHKAVALGRLGGLKGGKARAASLTDEQRIQIARKAALKRWVNSPK